MCSAGFRRSAVSGQRSTVNEAVRETDLRVDVPKGDGICSDQRIGMLRGNVSSGDDEERRKNEEMYRTSHALLSLKVAPTSLAHLVYITPASFSNTTFSWPQTRDPPFYTTRDPMSKPRAGQPGNVYNLLGLGDDARGSVCARRDG
jgi:hypothetical protein